MKKHIFYIGLAIAAFLWGLYNGYNRSNTNASQVHQEENRVESVQIDMVALERNRARDKRHEEMMGLFRDVLTMIKQNEQNKVAQSKEKDYN